MLKLPNALLLLLIFLVSCSEQKQSQAKTGKIKAGNLEVYYEQKGEGEAVVFIHAGLQNHTMWEEQVEELSKQYKVVTLDMPYHGNTTGIDTTILAKDVVRTVLDSLQLQKVSIAGLSMGASVVQDFVIGYPERVSKAVFMAAGVNGLDRQITVDSLSRSWYTNFSNALEAKDTARAALEFTKAWSEGVGYTSDTLHKMASRYVYKTTLGTLQKHQLKGWPRLQNDPPAVDNIANIKVPVLIIDGDKDLPYIGVSCSYLAEQIPAAKRVTLKDAAHMLNLEKPKEVNALLLDFLKTK